GVLCAFFFQAEDGIRDFHVTGVQTCALPICRYTTRASSRNTRRRFRSPYLPPLTSAAGEVATSEPSSGDRAARGFDRGLRALGQIGRASCRERAEVSGVVE